MLRCTGSVFPNVHLIRVRDKRPAPGRVDLTRTDSIIAFAVTASLGGWPLRCVVAPVAQLDRVAGFEPVGWRFESSRAQCSQPSTAPCPSWASVFQWPRVTPGRRVCPGRRAELRNSRRAAVGQSSGSKTDMNAFCGIATLPTIFIRFLPSFCFSSSFRFRVMSPP